MFVGAGPPQDLLSAGAGGLHFVPAAGGLPVRTAHLHRHLDRIAPPDTVGRMVVEMLRILDQNLTDQLPAAPEHAEFRPDVRHHHARHPGPPVGRTADVEPVPAGQQGGKGTVTLHRRHRQNRNRFGFVRLEREADVGRIAVAVPEGYGAELGRFHVRVEYELERHLCGTPGGDIDALRRFLHGDALIQLQFRFKRQRLVAEVVDPDLHFGGRSVQQEAVTIHMELFQVRYRLKHQRFRGTRSCVEVLRDFVQPHGFGVPVDEILLRLQRQIEVDKAVSAGKTVVFHGQSPPVRAGGPDDRQTGGNGEIVQSLRLHAGKFLLRLRLHSGIQDDDQIVSAPEHAGAQGIGALQISGIFAMRENADQMAIGGHGTQRCMPGIHHAEVPFPFGVIFIFKREIAF